ncbi:MAG: family 16 glycoside hydrolase [Pseudomonadota bacterium]
MKKIVLPVFAALLITGAWLLIGDSDPAFQVEEGFTALYDGQSLSGWRKIGGDATFSADGESIVGHHGPGENTFLRTESDFEDFTLRLQMRWDEPGNSGVLFRAQQRGGNGRAFGYQYELDASERAWSAGVYDEARRGWLFDLEENPQARAAIRLDDWNDVEIEARGARITTRINGVLAADLVDGLDDSGYIALQVHSGGQGIMRWRRIRIQEHEPLAREGVGLSRTEDWRQRGLTDFTVVDGSLEGRWTGEESLRANAKRLLGDALIQFELPFCEGGEIRVRVRSNDGPRGDTYAELALAGNTATAKIVNASGVQSFDPIVLPEADSYPVNWVSVGDAMTVTVGEVDVLRQMRTGVGGRGRFVLEADPCGDALMIAGLAWQDLKQRGGEVDFYKLLDTSPAPPLSPEEALSRFRVAPGFEIELVAAEPMVEEPVAMAWDEFGRLYVVEMRGYMRDAYGSDTDLPVGQIVRLSDDNGDGRMDRSEVFLGELVNPRAVAVINEGILVGEPPNLWLCDLPRREALCENRRRVGDYAPNLDAGNIEHLENGLLPGIDNWLYNAKSDRRMRLVGGELEVQPSLFRGQWGIAKDDVGRLYYNHNSTWLMGDLFAAEDIVDGSGDTRDYAGLGLNLTEASPVYSVRVNPGVNRAYLPNTLRADGRLANTTGASGLAIYRGNQFLDGYRGDAFVPESAGNVVAHIRVSGDELGFSIEQQLYADEQWQQRDFLGSTDERFRPVDAANGPDGALYVIDMYRGIVQDVEYMTDELREQVFQRGLDGPMGMGRIWRVRQAAGQEQTFVYPGGKSPAELVALLQHDNGWVRDTAQRLLLKHKGEQTEALRALALAENDLAAIHALWTLAGRGELLASTAVEAARVGSVHRRQQALRAARELLTLEQLLALVEANQQASPLLRMQLTFLLGDHNSDARARDAIIAQIADDDGQDLLAQAAVRAGQGAELAMLKDALAAPGLALPSESGALVLAQLSRAAYLALRPDTRSSEPAPEALEDFLTLVASSSGEQAWQQVAMLEGLEEVTLASGFTPAALPAAPPIFADGSISELDPLWDARLRGRRAFTWPGDELAMGIEPLSPEQLLLLAQGEAFYGRCAGCHGAEGAGITGLAPPLAGATWVTGPPEWLARIILQGMTGPVTVNGIEWNGVMPPHIDMAELDDATLAGLMTYLRRSFGNQADPVSEQQAAEIRLASQEREMPWTVEELEGVPFDRGFDRFVGKYAISFVTMTISEQADGLYLSVPMYGEGLAEQLSQNTFAAAAGGESVRLEFAAEPGGEVNTMYMYRNGEKLTLKRKE